MKTSKNLTIIIPTRNEEESLGKLLKKFRKFKDFYKEIIVVDGKSKDRTRKIAKFYNCKVIKQKTLGYGSAIIQGVRKTNTKYFIIFDGDGSKDPIYLKRFANKMRNEKNGIIFAERYGVNAGSLDDTLLTYIGNRIFTILGKFFFSLKLNDILHTFFLCETKIFKKLKFKYNDFVFCVEFPILAKRNKIKSSFIPTIEKKRYDGVPKVRSFSDGFKILVGMVKLYIFN
tara:strand:- start:924 stop:1610 length:687 start_codon:yes stop_codon:yes gene_type:complete